MPLAEDVPEYSSSVRPEPKRMRSILGSFFTHAADVVGGAFILMKKPASFLLALLIGGAVISVIVSVAFERARQTLPSVSFCKWRLLSALPGCLPPVPRQSGAPHADRVDFPALVDVQHHALDEFFGYSDTGLELGINLKHAELAVQDLIVLVKASNLPIKDVLVGALGEFVIDAKTAGRELQMLSSKIHGTVDSIASYNQYALRSLESASSGRKAQAEAAVSRTFQSSMDIFAAEITRVLVHASATSVSLDRLEERLLAIHAICTEETMDTAYALDDLLWQLWTRLGGNRQQRRDLENRASVLRSVQRYRSVAMAFVAATTQTLTAVDVELSELRERLSTSALAPEVMPIEVHIASIERSVTRLQEEKLRRQARPTELGGAKLVLVGPSLLEG